MFLIHTHTVMHTHTVIHTHTVMHIILYLFLHNWFRHKSVGILVLCHYCGPFHYNSLSNQYTIYHILSTCGCNFEKLALKRNSSLIPHTFYIASRIANLYINSFIAYQVLPTFKSSVDCCRNTNI